MRQIPIKCPICEGHGCVVGGFYMVTSDQQTWTSSVSQEMCRTCSGTGIVYQIED